MKGIHLDIKSLLYRIKTMKRSTLFVAVGVFLLFIGGIAYLLKPNISYVNDNTIKSDKLSVEEAKSLMGSMIKNLINVYEKPKEIFKGDNVEIGKSTPKEGEEETPKEVETPNEEETVKQTGFKVENYDEVMSSIFTKNGIKQFENMKFSGKNYVLKENGNVYLLDNVVVGDNRFTGNAFAFGSPIIKVNSIRCNISFNQAEPDDKGEVHYAVFTKELKLVKQDDKWYIESFGYSNTKETKK